MAKRKGITPEDFFTEAVNLYKLGVEGDKEAALEAYKKFNKICAYYSKDYLARAYLGSATALLRRYEVNSRNKSMMASRGLKIIEKAFAKDPENTEIHRLRKFLYLELKEEGFSLPDFDISPGEELEICLSDESKKQLEEAKELHRRALAGDKNAAPKVVPFFEKMLREKPHNHLIRAYRADCLSMVGRDSTDNSLMFGNAIRAMMDFDKAVNACPDDIEIRLLRANFSYRLPEGFFRRSATAMGDFEYLIQRYEQDNSVFPKETYLRVMENLGEVYERLEIDEEAQLVWEKLFSLTGNPRYQARSKKSGEETHFDPLKARSMTWQQALQEGIRLHGLAVAGNKKAGRIAEALLQGLHKEKPRDAVAQGYYGSAMALVARDSGNTSVMFSKVIKGLKLLKEAVARDSNNPRLRILRGYLAYNLPEAFFHSGEMAVEDFKFLLKAYQKDKSIVSKELYFKILYNLGTVYQRLGDNQNARKVWSKLVKESGDPKYKALLGNY